MPGRRDLYAELGGPARRREPAQSSSATAHMLRGTLPVAVQADAAYTTADLTVRIQIGPVLITTRGLEAARSVQELHRQLGPVLAALFPDLTSELERQMARRAQLNGGEPAAARIAREADD